MPNALCKIVSAFANSAGGTLIIGIEMDNLTPARLDDGPPGPSKRDWIFPVINGGTFPAMSAPWTRARFGDVVGPDLRFDALAVPRPGMVNETESSWEPYLW